MLELATLGLLQREPLNGYRLKQQLEVFMSGCISANYGAIYPLLKRLEDRGCIKTLQQDSHTKIYTITEQGRSRWLEEMLDYPQESWVNARSRFMIKFFFFSHLQPKERIKLLENRLMVCRLRLEHQDLKNFPDDPYQATAWQRFKQGIEDEIIWLNQQLANEISQQRILKN